MIKLAIVQGSVRENRIGGPIGEWVRQVAEADERFDVDDADLREIALPMMDEPNHPRMKKYTKPHTLAWASRIDAADAFIFLFPEFNYSYAPAIKNALDYLSAEWDRKPVGFVNWGGNSGGTRAQVALRPVVTALGMVSTHGSVEINFPHAQVDENGRFTPSEQQRNVLSLILDELVALDAALKPLRG